MAAQRRREGSQADAAQSLVRIFQARRGFRPSARSGRGRRRRAHGPALDRGRPDDLGLGLPFWIDAELPWADETARAFRRLTIAQDTGSAIVGPARADLFFGSGEAAGARAGAIRHKGEVVCCCRAETGGEGDAAAPASPEAPQRRGDRALDRGRARGRSGGAERRCRRDRTRSRRAAPLRRRPRPKRRQAGRQVVRAPSRRSSAGSSASLPAGAARSTPRSTCMGSPNPRRTRRCAASCAIRRRAARGW